MHWVVPEVNAKEYMQAPWKHCSDATKAYLGMRFDKREEFKENLSDKEKARVQHEIDRIETTRAHFAANPLKTKLINELQSSFLAWKKAASEDATVSSEHYRQNKACTEPGCKPVIHSAIDYPRLGSGYQRASVRMRNSDLRERVATWAPPPTTSVTSANRVDRGPVSTFYGFRASAIYFKSDGEVFRGTTYESNKFDNNYKFPNQKVSMDEIMNENADNLLRKECDKDHIRYFHFPTNNMAWVEVCS